ncbi:hypothetical protein [Streptosporangium sp. NPDC002607]
MTAPMPSLPTYKDSGVRQADYSFTNNVLLITLARGEEVTVEIHDPNALDSTAGRPIVYLDQCHWSTLSKQLYSPARVQQSDKEPADHLINLARQGKIILPLSSGHFVETTITYDDKRQDIAATMLELSRGWQMRHPLRVRQNEIAEVFSRRYRNSEFKSPAVFTLEPEALSRDPQLPAKDRDKEDLPEEYSYLARCLTAATANYDVLMDPKKIEQGSVMKWVEYQKSAARQFKEEGFNASKRRKIVQGNTVIDVTQEANDAAAATGTTSDQLEDWYKGKFLEDLATMPFLAMYSDTLDVRLSNSNTNWVKNDFIDILFLSCATAYADFVVAEKAATNYLGRAWGNRPGSAPVVHKLSELVDLLPPS